MSVRGTKLSAVAYEKIIDMIRSGTFHPGDPLQENQLSQLLDMSRTPIREALHRLEEEGVIVLKSNIGAFVATADLDQLHNLYEAREALEGMIARLNCRMQVPVDPYVKIRKTIMELKDNPDCDNRTSRLQAEGNTLHSQLRERCGNPILQKMTQSIMTRLDSHTQITRTLPIFIEESAPEHIRILDALIARDAPAAESAARSHIRNSFKRILETTFQ